MLRSTDQNPIKKVRFVDNTSVALFPALEEAEAQRLWLAPEDFSSLRRQTQDEADSLKHRGYGILLKNAFDESCKQAQKSIDAFAQLPGEHYGRGSEVYLSRQHREERDRIHQRLITNVLRRQNLLLRKETPVDVMAERLCSISKKQSRSSRLFARRLGLADQRAVQEGDDLDKALALVKAHNAGNSKVPRRQTSIPKNLCELGTGNNDGKASLAGMFGLAQMNARHKSRGTAEQRSPTSNKAMTGHFLFPSSGAPNNNNNTAEKCCVSVIQSALNMLDFEDDDMGMDMPSTTHHSPMISNGLAMTA